MQMSTQRYEPLSLFGACYVLELAGGRVYIGWSRNLSNRLSEHWAGSGSIMTRTYPPVRVLQVVFPADYTVENNLTKHYAKCRGWEKADGTPNVRGGDYSALESRNPTSQQCNRRHRAARKGTTSRTRTIKTGIPNLSALKTRNPHSASKTSPPPLCFLSPSPRPFPLR